MFHYCFDCYTRSDDGRLVRFKIEGDRERREDCVAVHNAVLRSPAVSICGASLTERDGEE